MQRAISTQSQDEQILQLSNTNVIPQQKLQQESFSTEFSLSGEEEKSIEPPLTASHSIVDDKNKMVLFSPVLTTPEANQGKKNKEINHQQTKLPVPTDDSANNK